MKYITEIYDLEGALFVMEFSWKNTPQDWERTDLPDGHPMKTMFDHSDEDGSSPTWINVKCAEAWRFTQYPNLASNEPIERSGIQFQSRWNGYHAEKRKPDHVEDFQEAELLFQVGVNWDHCAHWEFGPQQYDENRKEWSRGDGYIHTCGEDLKILDAMNTAYNRAKQIMVEAGSWDG